MGEEIHFVKMEGAGNDYVYVDCFSQFVRNPQALARWVSRRHFGIGSDGLILIKPSPRADCFMDIYNADGSRGRTCGNGLRCTARYLWKKSGRSKKEFTIETLSGICQTRLSNINRRKSWVETDMGNVFVRNISVPLNGVSRLLPAGVFPQWAYLVDGGNLHCVVKLKCCHEGWTPVQALEQVDLKRTGDFLEHYEGFPSRVNVELCVDGPSDCNPAGQIFARVWERGSGETMACGSGACAIYQAFHKMDGLTDWCIFMPGGRLYVTQRDSRLWLGGIAADVFEGNLNF